ncbi:MAG: CAP domain-containing protein, partial [Gaiellaceae bacterium]
MSGLGSRLLLPVLVALFALVGAASTAGGATAPQARAATSFEASVLGEINTLRARHQLAPLRMNDRLAAAAGAHSQAMARQGFFRHESADGSSFWKRVQRFYGSRGYGYWSVGENLLWSSPSID